MSHGDRVSIEMFDDQGRVYFAESTDGRKNQSDQPMVPYFTVTGDPCSWRSDSPSI